MTKSLQIALSVFTVLNAWYAADAQESARQIPDILRCKYYYVFRTDTVDTREYIDSTMCLDVDTRNGKAVYYSELAYLYDSTLAAMSDAGKSYYDMMAAGIDGTYRGTKEESRYFIDYIGGKYVKYDRSFTMYFKGDGELMPMGWTPADVTDTICGYPCQTAVADYLGRRWSVWYTTEIPVTAGPWLLWGLPGLVLQAVDQDRLFVFRAKEIGYAPTDRSGHLEHLAERSKRLHSYSISRMEQTLNKVKSSYEAMDRMQGGSGFVIKANDDGTMEKFVPELKYIPLIPDEYWKKQDK